eukprot:371777_1
MIQIAILFCCVIIALSSEFAEDRQKEFNKIQKYETIRPVFDDTNLRLEFDAFNEHWTIQLEVNEDISRVVAHITDENGESVPYEQEPAHYECHYRGMILNAVSSFVSLSFCPGDGVMGTLWLRGQTLFIKPLNYYLDPFNEALTIADEHTITTQFKMKFIQNERLMHGTIREPILLSHTNPTITCQIKPQLLSGGVLLF